MREFPVSPPVILVATAVIVIAILALAALFLGGQKGRDAGGSDLARRDRAELERLRAFIDDLKETAWDHRDIDPALSTIFIDKIRTFERDRNQGNKELGP